MTRNRRSARRQGLRMSLAVLALAGPTPGCNEPPVPVAVRGAPPPLPDPEPPRPEALGPLEATLLATLEDNRTRTCPRPVLRGVATPGDATTDILALMEPSGALQRCFKAAADKPADLDERCAELPIAVRTAVGHSQACSPYLHGRRARPADQSAYLRIATGLAAIARSWADQGRPVEAVQLLLDGVRLGQDLVRGGATWLEAMISISGSTTLMRQANALLLRSPSLTHTQIEGLRSEVATLLSSETHASEHLLSDRVELQLYHLWPAFKRRTWEPPGGWPQGQPRPPLATDNDVKGYLLMWNALDELPAKQRAACPADSSLRVCIEGIEVLAEALNRDALARSEDAQGSQHQIELLVGLSATQWTKYMRRTGRRTFWLEALDHQLALLDPSTTACPSPDTLPLDSTRLGSPLRATAEPRSIVLRPPPWLLGAPNEGEGADESKDESLLEWRIACPAPASSPSR